MSKLSRITLYEREKIELYLKMKKSHRWIGKKLCRGHTDISREINRNSNQLFPYQAKDAQRLHDARLRKKNQKKLEKFKHKKLKKFVVSKLEENFSPDQIAGRLHNEPPQELAGETISHESIYQYIYNGEGRFEYLYPHLRTGRRKRQRRFDRKKRNTINIPERISIHLRPEEIDKKERVGDWETDSMIFSKQKEILSTQYERKTMLCRLHKLPNKTAKENEDAFLPTSIFLATDKKIDYNEETNTISFDISEVGPFSVVDGQHRIEGLKIAAQEVPIFRNFQISANIAINLDKISQMCHFLIVNSTQKSVDKAIEQEIHAELTRMVDLVKIPTLPKLRFKAFCFHSNINH